LIGRDPSCLFANALAWWGRDTAYNDVTDFTHCMATYDMDKF
jgi:hypothetical protein